MTDLAQASEILRDCVSILEPPQRVTVTDNAAAAVVLKSAAISGLYNPDLSPLMREPADLCDSREFDSCVLVAPAQIGKTASCVLNVIAHRILVNATDMMIVEKSQGDARDFSARRLDRMIADSPKIQEKMQRGKGKDNVYDKRSKSGAIINIAHPSKNAFAGKPIPLIVMTDYDRYPDDVGGEGGAFDQCFQRTKSFLSKGMVIAESTPSKPVLDPTWEQPQGSHEAPPTSGILGLYNNGDRRMAYSRCPHCEDYFCPSPNPDISLWMPADGSLEDRAAKACLICGLCGTLISQDEEREFKARAVWVKEGQRVDRHGVIHGQGRQSKRASFWVSGYFASFNSWGNLALSYARAKDTFEFSGDEMALKNCCNQMFGFPYVEQARRSENVGFQGYRDRAIEVPRFQVPEGVRTVITSVDVQGGKRARFEVLVTGFGEGNRSWPMDRFAITESALGGRINPATLIEDWGILTDRLTSTFTLPDGRELMNHVLCVDCGGEEGVYDRALEWYRDLTHDQKRRAWLVKGDSLTFKASQKAPKVKKTKPDSTKRTSAKVSSTGDVPVLMVNTHRFKDEIYNDLQREFDGHGYVQFLYRMVDGKRVDFKDTHFEELLNAEVRGPNGWEHIRGKNNETFDLFVYARAVWTYIGGPKINWRCPPVWAQAMATNSNVVTRDVRQSVKKTVGRRVRSGR